MSLNIWMQRRSQLEAMQATYKLNAMASARLVSMQEEAEQEIEIEMKR